MTTETCDRIRVEHAIPGRLRLKYHPMKSNRALAQDLHRKLSSIEGVTHVETQPTIGGVTVHYEARLVDSIDFFLKIAAAFGLAAADIDPKEIEEWMQLLHISGNGAAQSVPDLMQSLGQSLEAGITKLSRRELNMGIILPMILTALGVRSLLLSEQLRAPSWYEYFWFAFGTYYTLNKPESPGDAAT
jgi:hypothetical protein